MIEKVMIINKNPGDASMVEIALTDSGFEKEISKHDSAESALAQAQELKPDFVVVDLELEDMSGYDVTKKIKEFNTAAKVVMVADEVEDIDPDQAKEAGVDDQISKAEVYGVLGEVFTKYNG